MFASVGWQCVLLYCVCNLSSNCQLLATFSLWKNNVRINNVFPPSALTATHHFHYLQLVLAVQNAWHWIVFLEQKNLRFTLQSLTFKTNVSVFNASCCKSVTINFQDNREKSTKFSVTISMRRPNNCMTYGWCWWTFFLFLLLGIMSLFLLILFNTIHLHLRCIYVIQWNKILKW